jgi:hypothetical protein
MNMLRVFSLRMYMLTCSRVVQLKTTKMGGDDGPQSAAPHLFTTLKPRSASLHGPRGPWQLSNDAVAGAIPLQPGPPVTLCACPVLLAGSRVAGAFVFWGIVRHDVMCAKLRKFHPSSLWVCDQELGWCVGKVRSWVRHVFSKCLFVTFRWFQLTPCIHVCQYLAIYHYIYYYIYIP